MLKKLLPIVFLFAGFQVEASLIKISADSDLYGLLGFFVVDTLVLDSDTDLVASQFESISFADPLSTITINDANLGADDGVTYFGWVGGVWTVTGGGGNSAVNGTFDRLIVADSNYVKFRTHDGSVQNSYRDVSWTTTAVSVPEPSVIALLAVGLFGLGFVRRRKA